MTIKKLSGLLLVVLALVSCKKELEPQESSATADSTVVATTENPVMPTATAAPTAQPVQMQQNVSPGTVSPAMAPAPVAKGMNPAHGQPGHRCDIAVGAPLNSPAGKTTPQATLNQPTSVNQSGTGQATIVPTTAPSNSAPALLNAPAAATAPGMNPPHGQPGHKCDVAVGAPLPKS